MSNAFKFNDDASGGVGVYKTKIINEKGAWLNVEVTDSGPGISDEDMGRIFQPYVQLQSNAGGTGLGLASVVRQVHALGGGPCTNQIIQ